MADDEMVSVTKAIRPLFDDLHDIDLSIERAGKWVSELMATRMRKVGMDWQKHRHRPGWHPEAYRSAERVGARGGLPIATKRGSSGLLGASVRRFGSNLRSARPFDDECPGAVVEFGWQGGPAVGRDPYSSARWVGELMEGREGALKPIGRLMRACLRGGHSTGRQTPSCRQ